ncbi:hypothetical protein [Streptomyces sp. NRRL WC-3725]|uniref:hypothetical protein n=1 Tax=Streptomyces sp. NRRL WC-3725 TaxID=1463933 RepID=UPI00131B0998|nr:hypothetical protein [Streptomyces sp. NRRL WC-3725]
MTSNWLSCEASCSCRPAGAARRRIVEQADTRSSRPTAVADDGPHTVPGAHVCPSGVCARRERRRPGQELPVCEVFDVALRFDAGS